MWCSCSNTHDTATERHDNPAQGIPLFDKEDAKYGGSHGEGWVKEQTKRGNLHPKRKGKAANSPLYYSKAELLQAKAAEDAVAANIFNGTSL